MNTGFPSPVDFSIEAESVETENLVHLGGPKFNLWVNKCIELAKLHTGAQT